MGQVRFFCNDCASKGADIEDTVANTDGRCPLCNGALSPTAKDEEVRACACAGSACKEYEVTCFPHRP